MTGIRGQRPPASGLPRRRHRRRARPRDDGSQDVAHTWSETTPTFVLASASGLCGAVAVGELDTSLLLYPSYHALGNGAIAALILHRRRLTSRGRRSMPSANLERRQRRERSPHPLCRRGCLPPDGCAGRVVGAGRDQVRGRPDHRRGGHRYRQPERERPDRPLDLPGELLRRRRVLVAGRDHAPSVGLPAVQQLRRVRPRDQRRRADHGRRLELRYDEPKGLQSGLPLLHRHRRDDADPDVRRHQRDGAGDQRRRPGGGRGRSAVVRDPRLPLERLDGQGSGYPRRPEQRRLRHVRHRPGGGMRTDGVRPIPPVPVPGRDDDGPRAARPRSTPRGRCSATR
jgi:hypothetical protein